MMTDSDEAEVGDPPVGDAGIGPLEVEQPAPEKPAPLLFRLVWYGIPICGGFCAPTENPEKSCFRHFSNENTPPQPCLNPRTCRTFFEHNTVMRSFGKIGFGWFDRHRKPVLFSAFTLSMLAWVFTIFAANAITTDRTTLRRAHWVKLRLDGGSVRFFVGLQKFARHRHGEGWSVKGINNKCDDPITYSKRGSNATFTAGDGWLEDCHNCDDAAGAAMRLVITACITQVFQITTDLQRTTRYGDLNCQKFFGVITGLYGFASSLGALKSYRRKCFLSSDLPPWGRNYDVTVTNDETGEKSKVTMKVRAGLAYALLFAATVLKAYDVICHLLVPTPSQKHRPEEERLKLVDYMKTATRTEEEELLVVEAGEPKSDFDDVVQFNQPTAVLPETTEAKEEAL